MVSEFIWLERSLKNGSQWLNQRNLTDIFFEKMSGRKGKNGYERLRRRFEYLSSALVTYHKLRVSELPPTRAVAEAMYDIISYSRSHLQRRRPDWLSAFTSSAKLIYEPSVVDLRAIEDNEIKCRGDG